VNTGDKVATTIFWLIMGGGGLLAGTFILVVVVWRIIHEDGGDLADWVFLVLSVLLIAVAVMGIRQCIATLRGKRST